MWYSILLTTSSLTIGFFVGRFYERLKIENEFRKRMGRNFGWG